MEIFIKEIYIKKIKMEILKYNNGDFYEGDWINDKKEGNGIIKYKKWL